MSTSALPYQEWIDQALRDVIRQALLYAREFGLPLQHHFYITFRTDADGVEVSPRLKAQHPDEMTIVLQHQFWDLVVDEDAFFVTLKFGGKRDRLRVPFQAMTAFADPAVNFGLQFKQTPADDDAKTPDEGEKEAADGPAKTDGARNHGSVIPLDTFRKK
ncbi:MAG: SspB family protein [Rhodoplanes sp.]